MTRISMIFRAICITFLIMSFMACSDDDDLEVEFFLTTAVENETPEPANEFRYGDDIGFLLRIRNTSNDNVDVGSDRNIIDTDIFTVYKENGEMVGKPWKEMGETYVLPLPLYAGSYRQWQAVWRGKETTRSVVLLNNEDNNPLAIGNYYCRFVVRLPNRNVVCNQHFVVIP